MPINMRSTLAASVEALPCLDIVQLQQAGQLRDDIGSVLFVVLLATAIKV